MGAGGRETLGASGGSKNGRNGMPHIPNPMTRNPVANGRVGKRTALPPGQLDNLTAEQALAYYEEHQRPLLLAQNAGLSVEGLRLSEETPRVSGRRTLGRTRPRERAQEFLLQPHAEDEDGPLPTQRRVEANRQSAQRSRQRKLAQNSELENTAKRLERDLAASEARARDAALRNEASKRREQNLLAELGQLETMMQLYTQANAGHYGPSIARMGSGGQAGPYPSMLQSLPPAAALQPLPQQMLQQMLPNRVPQETVYPTVKMEMGQDLSAAGAAENGVFDAGPPEQDGHPGFLRHMFDDEDDDARGGAV